jgi:hypothetical protein
LRSPAAFVRSLSRQGRLLRVSTVPVTLCQEGKTTLGITYGPLDADTHVVEPHGEIGLAAAAIQRDEVTPLLRRTGSTAGPVRLSATTPAGMVGGAFGLSCRLLGDGRW